MHAVSWGDPDILRSKLQASFADITPEQLSSALQQALVCVMRARTKRALQCVSMLIDAGASLDGLSLNVLFAPKLAKYAGQALHDGGAGELHLREIELKLLTKLGVRSLSERAETKESTSASRLPGLSVNTFRERCTSASVTPGALSSASTNRRHRSNWHPRMMLEEEPGR
jgi:hypothetical protein